MNNKLKKYSFFLLKGFIGLSFMAAGLAKLGGVEMMVAEFDTIGFGQWFRYLTGAIMLVVTMGGAALAHWIWLGPSAIPAVFLGGLAGVVAYAYREQVLPKIMTRLNSVRL